MSIELKVKVKSLAAEARIIKKEEQKQLAAYRWKKANRHNDANKHLRKYDDLYRHRKDVVSLICRLTHIARGYGKGLAYKDIEPKVKSGKLLTDRNCQSIENMINKYGNLHVPVREWVGKENIC